MQHNTIKFTRLPYLMGSYFCKFRKLNSVLLTCFSFDFPRMVITIETTVLWRMENFPYFK